jgi:hypothetical protein
MTKIYKTKYFNKWQKKSSELEDASLIKAINELSNGLFEANLGGGLYKKRIAMQGHGKSSSYRTIIASKSSHDTWVFIYGFSKSELSNISSDDLLELKSLADDLFNIADDKLSEVLIEVSYEK